MSEEKKSTVELLGDKLTKKQKALVDNVIFLNMSLDAAAKDAGYEVTSGSDETIRANLRNMGRVTLNSTKVKEYVAAVRSEMEQTLLIDKFFIIRKFKELSEQGGENTQLKATENLGKILGLYVDKQEVSVSNNPGVLAKEAFQKRLQLFKAPKEDDEEEQENHA